MLKKATLLTRPTLAVISPARPESAKTGSSPWDESCPKQGRSEGRGEAYVRYVESLSEARTKVVDFLSILLEIRQRI
jgi:hypothetical protein